MRVENFLYSAGYESLMELSLEVHLFHYMSSRSFAAHQCLEVGLLSIPFLFGFVIGKDRVRGHFILQWYSVLESVNRLMHPIISVSCARRLY